MKIKAMRKAVQSLMTAYKNGSIHYPRVDYDYIAPDRGRPPSHPKIDVFSPFCKPMRFSSYELTKNTLPLFLANKGISTPASLMRILEFIDTLYDDSLRPRFGKQKKIDRIVSALNEHIQMHTTDDIPISSFLDEKLPEGKASIRPYSGSLMLHQIPIEPMPSQNRKAKKEKRRDSVDNYTIKYESIHTDSIEQSIELMKKHRILEEYVSRQNDIRYIEQKRKRRSARSRSR